MNYTRSYTPKANGTVPSPAGGGGRIRTYEGISQQIYSLPPLAAWVPLLKMSRVFCGARAPVSMSSEPRNRRGRGKRRAPRLQTAPRARRALKSALAEAWSGSAEEQERIAGILLRAEEISGKKPRE